MSVPECVCECGWVYVSVCVWHASGHFKLRSPREKQMALHRNMNKRRERRRGERLRRVGRRESRGREKREKRGRAKLGAKGEANAQRLHARTS